VHDLVGEEVRGGVGRVCVGEEGVRRMGWLERSGGCVERGHFGAGEERVVKLVRQYRYKDRGVGMFCAA